MRADFTKKTTHNLMQMQQQLGFPPRLVLSKDTPILLNFQSTQERKKERKQLESGEKREEEVVWALLQQSAELTQSRLSTRIWGILGFWLGTTKWNQEAAFQVLPGSHQSVCFGGGGGGETGNYIFVIPVSSRYLKPKSWQPRTPLLVKTSLFL